MLCLGVIGVGCATIRIYAQGTVNDAKPQGAPTQASGGTSTDLFVMFGSDFNRPGLLPRANYNLGIGHTFAFLKKNPLGDELTIAYTYENAGTTAFSIPILANIPKVLAS